MFNSVLNFAKMSREPHPNKLFCLAIANKNYVTANPVQYDSIMTGHTPVKNLGPVLKTGKVHRATRRIHSRCDTNGKNSVNETFRQCGNKKKNEQGR